VIVRYQAKPFDHFDPLIPVADENPLDERTNYLTDDSDSDLDVFVDPNKTKIPPKYKLE